MATHRLVFQVLFGACLIGALDPDAIQDDCQQNEVVVECGGCEGSCEFPEISPLCSTTCKPRRCECVRAKGFLRAKDGACIRFEDCFNYKATYNSPGIDLKIPRNSILGRMLEDLRREIIESYKYGKKKSKKKSSEKASLGNSVAINAEGEMIGITENPPRATTTERPPADQSSNTDNSEVKHDIKENSADEHSQGFDVPPKMRFELEPSQVSSSRSERQLQASTETPKVVIENGPSLGSSTTTDQLPISAAVSKEVSQAPPSTVSPKDSLQLPLSAAATVSGHFESRCLAHCCEPPCGSCKPPCGLNCPPPCGT